MLMAIWTRMQKKKRRIWEVHPSVERDEKDLLGAGS
jgi:hypothetical protein